MLTPLLDVPRCATYETVEACRRALMAQAADPSWGHVLTHTPEGIAALIVIAVFSFVLVRGVLVMLSGEP